ncbi:MAG: Hsp70 family protein [Pseudonocardia sp.]
MRNTIDFGIDLGTTNSALAVFRDGEAVVIKNNDGWDYTPSAVWIPRPGEVHVGRAARDMAETDPDNAAIEFKLEMGLAGVTRRFAGAGIELTPPELSAEVLRSLRADAKADLGEEPSAAVITVPAAFELNQNHATGRAAELAGLGTDCPLLQEPTAAAFAYGLADRSDRAYWMVFDFGGGTFDAALVSKRDGKLLVLNHAGDPNLGGKLIDWAIVEQLLVPAVIRDFGLREFRRDNPAWRVNFGKLKAAAEQAKIRLSRAENAQVTCPNPLTDDRGGPLRFEFVLTRAELDRVAEPYYRRAIKLCREALKLGNLAPGDVDRLLLVGGVTLAPSLRERLADATDGLGIQIDHSQDPRTVVARGAAIFARSVPVDRPLQQPKAGEFTVELRYDRVTSSTAPVVAGRLHAASPVSWDGYGVVLANPAGRPPFRSGRIAVTPDGTFVSELIIAPEGVSTFEIELTDRSGTRQQLAPATFSISCGLEVGTVLTHSLGIGQSDLAFASMLRKDQRLPARSKATFRTTALLRRDDPDGSIRIPLYEGERDRADRNRLVATLHIRPRDIRIDVPLGSDVEVTVEVDTSRRVSVVADVPLLREQFEAEIDLDGVAAPSPEELDRGVADLDARLAGLRGSVRVSQAPTAEQLLADLDASGDVERLRSELVAARVDAGAANAGGLALLGVHARLDEIERAVKLPELQRHLREGLDICRDLVSAFGDASDRRELAELETRAGQPLDDPDVVQALIDRTVRLQIGLLRAGGQLEIVVFDGMRAERHKLSPRRKADELIKQGERAVAAGDRTALGAVNEQLRRLWPIDQPLPAVSDVQKR